MNFIEIKNIVKTYGNIIAVNDVSFDVKRGEVFGLIGPDGAGKTSIFRILTTLLLADAGMAVVGGFDVVKDYGKIRSIVGYMPGKFSLYQDLTVQENLSFFATVFGTSIEENYDLIKDIYNQIKPFKNRRAGKLSGGMKQKLALCCALIHNPAILFLDEPTTGVDVVSRKEFWDILYHLKKRGISIIVSTPYMDEATQCDRIALIQKGSIMRIDTPDNIIKSYPKTLFAVKADNIYKLLLNLRAEDKVQSVYAFGEYIHLTLETDDTDISDVKLMVEGYKIKGTQAKIIEPSIEDMFIYLMGKHGDNEDQKNK